MLLLVVEVDLILHAVVVVTMEAETLDVTEHLEQVVVQLTLLKQTEEFFQIIAVIKQIFISLLVAVAALVAGDALEDTVAEAVAKVNPVAVEHNLAEVLEDLLVHLEVEDLETATAVAAAADTTAAAHHL